MVWSALPMSENHAAPVVPIESPLTFDELVRRHQTTVVAYCLRALGDAAEARDAAQEVFLTAWRERERYEERGKLKIFLLKIARNRCLASQKKRRRKTESLESVPPREDPAFARFEAKRAVEDALSRVPEERAEVVRLKHLDGLSLAEIAEVVEAPVGTVKSRLSRGLADLRREMTRGD